MTDDRFLRRLLAARVELGLADPADAQLFYRRAVATPDRQLLPPPPAPDLRIARGVAVLVASGPLTPAGVDDVLCAARAAGAEWAAAWVTDADDVAVLRAMDFLPL
jgi:hypothetical protein